MGCRYKTEGKHQELQIQHLCFKNSLQTVITIVQLENNIPPENFI